MRTRLQRWICAALAATAAIVPRTGQGAPAATAPKLTRAPELTEFVAAPYPESELAAGRGAAVVLRVQISASGAVEAAEVIESAGPAFDAAAQAAVLKFRFTPAEVDGKPSAIKIVYRYEFTPPPPPPTTAGFEGVVRRRGEGEPLAGVAVSVRAEGMAAPLVAVTDAEGKFRFEDLPAGAATVTISGEQLTTVQTGETLAAGEQLAVSYEVSLTEASSPAAPQDDLEIVVVAPPLRREVVSTAVRAEEASKVPGASGDVLRVVESMPGVARSAAGSGQLVVWGAAPQDTRIYVDGVPIPRLYHEGGLRSVIHPMLVETIELLPGGYGAQWGRGLGGLVSATTRTPTGKRVRGRVAADLLDASTVLSVPIGKRLHLAAAARYGYLKHWADRVIGREATQYLPIPRYGDGQLRLAWRPGGGDRVEFVGLVSADRFARGVPSADPALALLDERSTDFGRIYARWTRDRGDGHTLTVTPFVGYTRTRQDSRFGAVATSLAAETYLFGVRANRGTRVTSWLHVDVGVDAELSRVGLDRRGALALPPREGDVRVFGQPPPGQISADRWHATLVGVAPYAQAELSLFTGKLRISPGLRLDPYARSLSRRNPPAAGTPAVGIFKEDFAVEPRLAISYQPVTRLQLRAAAGLYRQMPAPEDLSASFGNPTLPAARALHTVLGAKVGLTRTLSLDVTGFFTRSRQLAMRSPAEAPLPAAALEPIGGGRAHGAQALLRQEIFKERVFGWVAYTIMRSERRDSETGVYRLSDFDQTHVLTAVLAYQLPRGFDVSGRFRYATGAPRTPVIGAYHDATQNLYQPIFGAHNSIRIPAFVQLDLRVGKQFKIARTTLDIFLEVLNAWNQRNREEIVYSPDYQQRGYITGFPVLPAFGLQWDF